MNVYIRKKDLDYSAMRGPCPEGFHVPHYKEWQAIINIWLELGLPEQDGELYATYLKLPFAGERGSSGTLTDQTQLGYYWSSPSNDDSFFFWIGHYDDPTATTFGWRAVARSLRAFKDVPAKPDSSWTVIYDGSAVAAGAGIFWNATLGLISLSSDGFSRKTIQDKNLGATNVGDYGSHFQRGNNYGFPSSGTLSDTSATQVDASGYGPGNYYSSSTYITGSEDWSSVRNDNLWGHQTGAAPIMTTMKNAYVGEYWSPNANTIAYFPFSSDAIDVTGNNTLTNSGTQDGLGRKFTSASSITTPSGIVAYVNYRIKINAYPSGTVATCLSNQKGMGYYSNHSNDARVNKKIFVWTNSSFNVGGSVSFQPTIGTWHNISYGYDGTKTIYSIDGVSGTLYNGSGYNFGNEFVLSQGNNITISKLILETTARTATEITNYYNKTKSTYGL